MRNKCGYCSIIWKIWQYHKMENFLLLPPQVQASCYPYPPPPPASPVFCFLWCSYVELVLFKTSARMGRHRKYDSNILTSHSELQRLFCLLEKISTPGESWAWSIFWETFSKYVIGTMTYSGPTHKNVIFQMNDCLIIIIQILKICLNWLVLW